MVGIGLTKFTHDLVQYQILLAILVAALAALFFGWKQPTQFCGNFFFYSVLLFVITNTLTISLRCDINLTLLNLRECAMAERTTEHAVISAYYHYCTIFAWISCRWKMLTQNSVKQKDVRRCIIFMKIFERKFDEYKKKPFSRMKIGQTVSDILRDNNNNSIHFISF